MSDQSSSPRATLYAKLLGETATISWQELQPFFARGVTLKVDAGLNLVEVATALSLDEKGPVSAWLELGELGKLDAEQARDWMERDADLWAVVVAPWVLVQERGAASASRH